MFKINVVALPGCELCSSLIDRLQESGLPFNIANAEEHESLCDMLEALLFTTMYPIVTFEIPQRVYFICMPNEVKRLGWCVLDDTSTSVGVKSVDEIYSTIMELRNKINS